MKHSAHTTRFGFSLIEMLVVVAITAIVLAISFPMIGAMQRDSSESTGINTVSVAIPSIRRYATAGITFANDLNPSTTASEMGRYSGAAAIFTPAGEVRLTKNQAGAWSNDLFGTKLLEQHGPQINDPPQPLNKLPERELNGFEDLGIDYLQLPADTGVAGINRVSGMGAPLNNADDNDVPILLPPPFAVWYNQNGYLVVTGWDLVTNERNEHEFVYYDGNYTDGISAKGARSFRGNVVGGYNPDHFNPNSAGLDPPLVGGFKPTNWDDAAEKYVLPFEALEAVVGVYVYSQAEFLEANGRWDDGETDTDIAAPHWINMTKNDNQARWEWMKENGEMLLFSKQSGALMRNRNE